MEIPDRLESALRDRKLLWMLSVVLVGVIAGAAGIWAFARSTYTIGPARVTVSAQPSLPGRTEVDLPPFGSIEARTHRAPLLFVARLDEVDITGLQRFASQGITEKGATEALTAQFERKLFGVALKGVLAAGLIAFFVAWTGDRSWRMGLLAAAVSVVLTTGSFAWAYAGYDQHAFREPVFRGSLTQAPRIIDMVEARVGNIGDLQKQVADTVRSISAYYSQPQAFALGGSMRGTFKVLAVSDIHLDPLGFSMADDLARAFDVGLVIDAGDVNVYGTSIEASRVAQEVALDRPQVFVTGNHDSRAIRAALRSVPKAQVLDETSTVVGGLYVYGISDPATDKNTFIEDNGEARAKADAAAAKLREAMRSGEATPDVVVVHNPVMSQPFVGWVPVVVDGHTHVADLRETNGTWLLNAGTTGGISYSATVPVPHTAAVLYYTAGLPRRLIAIDRIVLAGAQRETSLSRTVVDVNLLPSEEATLVPSLLATSFPSLEASPEAR